MIISLSGYMGAGKTSIGTRLARLMKWDFIDLDDFITQAYGQSPAQIINHHGERALRIAENQALNQLLTERDQLILSLGGGTLTEAFNFRLVDSYTFHVFIDTPWDQIISRITANSPERPLWHSDPDTREQHYQQRLPIYRRAHLIFPNHYDTPADAAHHLMEILKKQITFS